MKALSIIVITCWGCDHSSATSVDQIVMDNCVQHPVSLFLEEYTYNTRLYKFGPQDQEFRDILTQLTKQYHLTGKDLDGNQKYGLVSKYVPHYMEACQNFFAPISSHCSQFNINSYEFDRCIEPYNEAYQYQFKENFQLAGAALLDLESITFIPITP